MLKCKLIKAATTSSTRDVGRTWESREGDAGNVWAYNKTILPYAYDIMWGPNAPAPYTPGTLNGIGRIGATWGCPAGTMSVQYVDWSLVRVWQLCALNSPIESVPTEPLQCSRSSPAHGNPVLALPGLKLQIETDSTSASGVGISRVYRSDTYKFEVSFSDLVAVKKWRGDPFVTSPATFSGSCVTLPYSWTGTAPWAYYCFPIVAHASGQFPSSDSSILIKAPGTGYREVNLSGAGQSWPHSFGQLTGVR
jgi:hypothetical protein